MRKIVGAAMVVMVTMAVSVAMGADPYPAGAKGELTEAQAERVEQAAR